MSVRRPAVLIALAAALALLWAPPASAAPRPAAPTVEPTCNLPESDAEALVILNQFYPNRYYWDHTDLTIAIQAAPNVGEEYIDAIEDAIETWDSVLRECFDGLITLTNVTDTTLNAQLADIVVHYVPTAGGSVFAGYAICGVASCPNILVRSDLPSFGGVQYTPEYFYWVTLHEIGHALGLGHATNLLESTDLMGYGWIGTTDAVLSQCDIDALAYIFSWALNGTAPAPPGPGPYVC
jgi:predicted Zn-dependent protease